MQDFRVRIGRVRKNGGADLKVIDGKFQHHAAGRELCEKIVENAETIAGYFPDMAGYVVVAWDSRGRMSTGWRCSGASPVQAFAIPQFVADRLRVDVAVGETIDRLKR